MDFDEMGGTDGAVCEDNPDDYGVEYDDSFAPDEEFALINSVVGDGIQKEKEMGISTLAFDTHEELLWIGTKSGHVTSYYGTQLQKYTSFQIHPTEDIRNIITLDHGILALTQTSLRSQIRRGIPCFTHSSENMQDMHSLLFNNRNGRVLMGGMQEKLLELDLTSARETRVETIEGGSCAILRDHCRFVCCGDATAGRIQLRDPLTLKVQHTLEAHNGVLSDFDVHGHHLVTCGQSLRHGISQPDRFLMVYDLRIMRAVSPIQVMVLPYQLRFLPALSSRIAVLSSMGQVQMVDTAALSAPQISIFQVTMPLEGCNTISMDVSPSNQCLAFGDTSNSLHLYSSVPEPALNPFARETEFADQVEQLPPMDINDPLAIYSSIPRPHLPPGQSCYLSDYWPERFSRPVFRPTPPVDPEVLRSMKLVGTIGYARNVTNMRRNQVRYDNVKTTAEATEKLEHSGPGGSLVPKSYRRVAVKLSKMGTDDFDFDRYNRTGFCGLEASLPNSYCNSMLQILYFTEKLRLLMLNHTCSRENCICCELSFLFHMMDISPGMPCQSGNFLRAMRTIPEAAALGLIFTDQNSVWGTNVPRLIQSWNRFILHQISIQVSQRDFSDGSGNSKAFRASSFASPMKSIVLGDDDSAESSKEPNTEKESTDSSSVFFHEMFGMDQEKVNVCSKCKIAVTKEDTVLLCNLVYPETKSRTSFEQIVCSSLSPEQTTPAWCETCRKYQSTNQNRHLRCLPHILSLNAGMDNACDVEFWRNQMDLLYNEHKGEEEAAASAAESKPAEAASLKAPPPNAKPCRYGLGCNRPDCKFWHPEADAAVPEAVDVGDKLAKINVSWVPTTLKLSRLRNGKVTSGVNEAEEKEGSGTEVMETKTYNLFAVCSTILDPSTEQPMNIVAAVNVGPYYHAKIASPVSQWYIFNDFSINTISQSEAVWFNLKWKIPCLLFYCAAEEPTCLKDMTFVNPISAEVFKEDKSLAQKGRKRITFSPFSPEEMPQKGDLVAIDAEFVTLNQEESELRSDGKVSTIKAAQMSVARITCVRGNGTHEGEPFIDDYISTQEQVVDYVTKFSGIKPGDLDANFSSKHLTTLKSTYKKLRYLVDTGCIFIGHGLKNDFKVINLVVPVEQVIDTVHLFHLPHNRMVSLKFLAWQFLGKKIQETTHDSIEDAVTALALYKKYQELKKEDTFIEALNALYEKGKECNWKVPED